LAEPQTVQLTDLSISVPPIKPINKLRGRPLAKQSVPLDYIISLRNKQLTHDQIAILIGTSRANISQRLKDIDDQITWTKEFRANRAFILARKQQEALEYITPSKLQKASVNNIAYYLTQLHTMERLEMGLSTSNIAYADMIEGRKLAIKELDELDKRYAPKVDQ